MVTADGEVLTVSADEHSDLFWALRGGGGNFGVVTAFEFELHELGPEIAMLDLTYPIETAPDLLPQWRDLVADAPDEVTVDALFWSVPAHPAFPEELHETPILVLAGMYAGPPDEGEAALREFRDLGEPIADESQRMPYTDFQSMLDPFFEKGARRNYWKSRYLDELSAAAIETIVEYTARCPSPTTIVPIRVRGGAVGRVDPAATAFAERDAPFMLSIDSGWEDPADDDENIAWTREFWDATAPYSPGSMYFNFAMHEEGEETVRATFGENYDRLVEVKETYDPENRFRLNQNIPPEA